MFLIGIDHSVGDGLVADMPFPGGDVGCGRVHVVETINDFEALLMCAVEVSDHPILRHTIHAVV